MRELGNAERGRVGGRLGLGSIYFVSRKVLAALLGLVGAASGAQAQDPEAQAWSAAERLGTKVAYQEFLRTYPVGVFADKAFEAIVSIMVNPRRVSESLFAPAAGGAPEPGVGQSIY